MKKALFVLVLSALLSGCAFTTENIDLSYTPQAGVAKIADAGNVTVSVQVNDQRQEKSNKVSSKKNGFGMETAPILANEDVTVTIRRAIELELQSRGFSIGNESVVTILAELTRFWNDHKMGFFSGDAIAELNISVLVKDKSGNILYSRNIQAQGIERNNQLANGNNARLALNNALENGMKSLFEDGTFISALIHDAKKSPSALQDNKTMPAASPR
jgi:uncharacterized lipoprotein YajG